MEVMGEQPTEPGWYNDPGGVYRHQAYWDAERWTGATRPGPDFGDGVIGRIRNKRWLARHEATKCGSDGMGG